MGQLKSRQFGTLDLNLIKHNMTFTSPQTQKESRVTCTLPRRLHHSGPGNHILNSTDLQLMELKVSEILDLNNQ